MTRQAVIELCRRAKTLAAITAAFEARGKWLTEHPEDEGIFEWGERLAMMREGLEMGTDQKIVDAPTVIQVS